MKAIKILVFSFIFLLIFIRPSSADVGSRTQISATVGDFYLNISGFAFPYANIVVSSNNVNIASAFVGKAGKFSILNIPVMQGFSHFCINATDIKVVNRTKACFDIKPMLENFSVNDLLLPPTLSSKSQEINEREVINIYGFTMPGAIVTVNFNRRDFKITADNAGFYKYSLKTTRAGEYVISASTEYAGRKSGNSSLNIKVLTSFEKLMATLRKLLTNIYFLLFVAILIIIPMIILISKLVFKDPFIVLKFVKLKREGN